MKRDLDCEECEKAWPNHKGRDKHGEEVIKVRGVTVSDFVCDGCAKPLPEGTIAVAVSVLGPARSTGRGSTSTSSPWKTRQRSCSTARAAMPKKRKLFPFEQPCPRHGRFGLSKLCMLCTKTNEVHADALKHDVVVRGIYTRMLKKMRKEREALELDIRKLDQRLVMARSRLP